MQVARGAFDDMELSVLSIASLCALSGDVGADLDVRRVRQNVIVETASGVPYAEDKWSGGLLTFGSGGDAVSIRVARRIPRCMMVNLCPDTSIQDPRVLKELARSRDSCLGIYGAIDKTGAIRVGDVVRLQRA